MWWLTNTASPSSKALRTLFLCVGLVACLAEASAGQVESPRPPASVVAGTDFSITTAGSGKAIFYLVGPSYSQKQQIDLGQEIHIKADDASAAGRYLAILCS